MKAWELLDSPEKWTKGAFSKDALGNSKSDKNKAVCWCVLGAIKRCYEDFMEEQYATAKVRIAVNLMYSNEYILYWNDATERTYEEVHQLLKKLDV